MRILIFSLVSLTSSQEDMKPFKLALQDLLSCSKAGAVGLGKAIKTVDSQEKRTKGSGSKAPKPNTGRLPILDRAEGLSSQAAWLRMSEITPLDSLTEPKLLFGVKEMEESLVDPSSVVVQQGIEPFNAKWKTSALRTDKGRGERCIKGPAMDHAMAFFHKVVLETAIVPVAKLPAEFQVAAYGLAKGAGTVSVERARGPTLRVQAQGTKFILMIQGDQLREFMQESGINGINPDTMLAFFKSMSREVVQKYVEKGYALVSTTVGPGDGVFIPFDWLFAEQVSKEADVMGIRYCFWLRTDLAKMEVVQRWLISAKRPINQLTSAIDVFSLEDMD